VDKSEVDWLITFWFTPAAVAVGSHLAPVGGTAVGAMAARAGEVGRPWSAPANEILAGLACVSMSAATDGRPNEPKVD
jgi:hypothetical protein